MWGSLASLQLHFDPQYQQKLRELEFRAQAEQYRTCEAMEREQVRSRSEMERERFKADADLNREYVKSNAAMEREQFKAGVSLSLQAAKAQAEMVKEQFSASEAWRRTLFEADREDGRERLKARHALDLEEGKHLHRLDAMQAELDNRARLMGIELSQSTVQKLMDEDTQRRASLNQQFEQRSQLRAEVFKMLASAVIQEKLAQKQHQREMAMATHQSELRRVEHYWNSVFSYLGKLVESNRMEAAKTEIDHLLDQWGAVA
ncbi:MAG: hypothetical protein IPP10_16010 [Candidatus Competibacteraceae bacterium]|nr:hypothetical protein [Candidatus Competibacteraceae bacterium]